MDVFLGIRSFLVSFFYVFLLTNGNSVLGSDSSSGHNVPPKPYAPPPSTNSGGQNIPGYNPNPSAPYPDYNPSNGNRGNNIYPNLPTNGNNDPYPNRNNGNNEPYPNRNNGNSDPYPNRGSYDPTPTNNRGKINLFHKKISVNTRVNSFFYQVDHTHQIRTATETMDMGTATMTETRALPRAILAQVQH